MKSTKAKLGQSTRKGKMMPNERRELSRALFISKTFKEIPKDSAIRKKVVEKIVNDKKLRDAFIGVNKKNKINQHIIEALVQEVVREVRKTGEIENKKNAKILRN